MRKSRQELIGCAKRAELDLLAGAYLAAHERRALSPSTVASYRRGLRMFVGFLARHRRRRASQIRPDDVVRFRTFCLDYLASLGPWRGRAHRFCSALTWTGTAERFCRWLVAQRHLLADPAAGLAPLWFPRLPPRVLSVAQVKRLLAVVHRRPAVDLRDRAIVELLYSSGLRTSELLALDLSDVDATAGEVLVRRGKGGRTRRVPVGPPALTALRGYLKAGRPVLFSRRSARDPHALFLSEWGTRLCSVLLEKMFRRRAAQARLTPGATPHTLRHSAAVHLLQRGATVRHVQAFLGHADLTTTAHYTTLDVSDLKDALSRCHPRRRIPA